MSTQVSGVVEENIAQLTDLFHLLSDKTRLNILLILSQGERNVSSLCEQLALPQPTVSHHLGLLRMKSLIANRRAGKQVFYGLDGRHQPDPESALTFTVEGYTVRVLPSARSEG